MKAISQTQSNQGNGKVWRNWLGYFFLFAWMLIMLGIFIYYSFVVEDVKLWVLGGFGLFLGLILYQGDRIRRLEKKGK